ncbi:MAG: hypothetical protein ACLQVN_12495, partial [Bryobacteraceae bacterium]
TLRPCPDEREHGDAKISKAAEGSVHFAKNASRSLQAVHSGLSDSLLCAQDVAPQPFKRLSEYEHWSLVWYAISALSAVATLVVVFCAAVIGFRQIRKAVRARQLGSALAILKKVESSKLRRARKLLNNQQFFANLADRVSGTWSEADTDKFIKEVSSGELDWAQFRTWLAALETTAILVMHDLALDEIL